MRGYMSRGAGTRGPELASQPDVWLKCRNINAKIPLKPEFKI
jgi:hypothetical protein